jgi:hypothetical protein
VKSPKRSPAAPDAREIVLVTLETLLEMQLQAVRMMIADLGHEPRVRIRTGRRRDSLVDCSVRVLGAAKRPLHVGDLLTELRRQFGRVTDRDSLTSALLKKAKQGVLVKLSGPATFALRSRATAGREA